MVSDLIDTINPFQKAFEILSKSVTKKVLKVIQDHIAAIRIDMTDEEADKLVEFYKFWYYFGLKSGRRHNRGIDEKTWID